MHESKQHRTFAMLLSSCVLIWTGAFQSFTTATEPLQGQSQDPNAESASKDVPRIQYSPPVPLEDYGKAFGYDAEPESSTNPEPFAPPAILDDTADASAAGTSNLTNIRRLLGSRYQELSDAVGQLGSPKFAARERASEKLSQSGYLAVPLLQYKSINDPDAEIRLRAGRLADLLDDRYQAELEAAFVRGDEDVMPGWPVAKHLIGDSLESRQLFVSINASQPKLISALDADVQTRGPIIELVSANLRSASFAMGQTRLPTKSDLLAVLMAMADPKYTPSPAVEGAMQFLLQRPIGQELVGRSMLESGDGKMSYSRELLSSFLSKTSIDRRSSWLFWGSKANLPVTRDLAIRTLVESDDPSLLGDALAALAKFKGDENLDLLRGYLDDEREIGKRIVGNQMFATQVRDVAMAAIAALYDIPTQSVGFAEDANHPSVGIIVSRLGFAVGDDAARKRTQAKVMELIEETKEP